MADDEEERERNRTALRSLAQHPILAEFRKETRFRIKALEDQQQRVTERIAGLEDRTAGQRIRLEAAERGYGEVNFSIGQIKDRWQERNERFAQMETNIKAAAEAAAKANEILRRMAYSIAGGTAVIMFVVGLWTLLIEPVLRLVRPGGG